jgi:hypothetical protein
MPVSEEATHSLHGRNVELGEAGEPKRVGFIGMEIAVYILFDLRADVAFAGTLIGLIAWGDEVFLFLDLTHHLYCHTPPLGLCSYDDRFLTKIY